MGKLHITEKKHKHVERNKSRNKLAAS